MVYRAKAYLKIGCPFSFKFLMFMTEAGLADCIEPIEIDDSTSEAANLREFLADKTKEKLSFPLVEITEGVFKSDSDELIQYYAEKNEIDPKGLSTFQFYLKSILPKMTGMFKELKALKAE